MADSVKIKITGDSSPFNKELDSLGKKAKSAISSTGSVLKGMLASQIVTKGVSALANGLKSAIDTGMRFEASMSEVQAISGATGAELEKLTETAKHYGETTMFSASQAAEALKYMALAGWDANQSMDALGGVLNLAASSGMDLGAASDAVTDYLSAFGMEANRAGYMADLMSYAQANANTSASQLADAYGNCASSMHAAGQDIETTTAMLMALANQGIKGSEAGTQMSAVMRDITQKMQNGAIQIGKTKVAVTDAQGNFRDLNDIMADVGKATEGTGSAQASAALMQTFSARSVKAVQTILGGGMDAVNNYESALRDAEGTAEGQAATMMDNLQGDIKIFQSAVEGLQITASESTNGIARSIVQESTDILGALNEAGKKGGLEGIADAAIAQIPKLLPKVTQGIEGLLSGLGKKLPGMVKNLVATVPDLLGSIGDLVPSLIESLSGAAAAAVEGLIGSLPTLVPALARGLGNMFTSAIMGIDNILSGLFGGVAKSLKGMGLMDKDLHDLVQEAVDNVDTSGYTVPDVTLPDISVDGEVDTTEYKAKIEGAMADLHTVIQGTSLSDADKKALERAILEGSGSDALGIAFRNLGASKTQAEAAAKAIEQASEAINGVFAEFGLDDNAKSAILTFYGEGLTMRSALMLYAGMDGEQAGSAVDSVKDNVADKLTELGVDPKVARSIARHVNAGESLESALETYAGLTPEEAEAKVSAVQTGVTANLEELGVSPTVAGAIAAYYLSGMSLSGALALMAGIDQSQADTAVSAVHSGVDAALAELKVPDDTAGKIQEYVDNGGSLKDALSKIAGVDSESEAAKTALDNAQANVSGALEAMGVPPGVAGAIAQYVVTGAGLEFALGLLTGVDGDEAAAAAGELQTNLDEIAKVYNDLKLGEKGIDLTSFREACTSANGDIKAALELLGVDDPDIEAAMASVETLADSIASRMNAAMGKVKDAFTNRKDDDEEAAEEAQQSLTEMQEDLHGKVDTWLTEYEKTLKQMDLSAEEYEAAMTNANEKATAMHNEIDATITAAQDWVSENAGKAKSEVQSHVSELDGIVAQVEDIEGRIDALSGKLDTTAFAQRTIVERGGGSRNMQATAFKVTADEYEKSMLEAGKKLQAASDAYDEECVRIQQQLNEGLITAEQAGEQQKSADDAYAAAEAQYDAEAQAALDKYNQHKQAILEGILQSNGDVWDQIQDVGQDNQFRKAAQSLHQGLLEVFDNPEKETLSFDDFLKSINVEDADIDGIADILGIDGNVLWEALERSFQEGSADQAMNLFGQILAQGGLDPQKFIEYGTGAGEALTEGLEGIDLTGIASPVKKAIDEGWLFNTDGTDIGDGADTLETALMTALENIDTSAAEDAGEGISEGVKTGEENKAGEASDASETMAGNAAEAALTGAKVNSPSAITIPAGEGIAEGVKTGIENKTGEAVAAAQQLGLQAAEAAKTDVSVGATVTVDASGIDESGMASAASGAVTGALAAASAAAGGAGSVGAQITAGMASGINAGRSNVIRAAVRVAQDAIRAMKAALQINSPSRVTMEIGEYTGEGFGIGLSESLGAAIRAAQNVVGAANLRPQTDFSGVSSSISGAIDDFREIESGRDIVLTLNGREMARASQKDYNTALSNYAKRVNMGYGRG